MALTARAEAEIACGRAHSVISELEALVVEHPYREPLWAQLITAYYVADRQSDALDAYGRLKPMLADDLGIDPGPTVESLHQRILRQEPLDIKQVARHRGPYGNHRPDRFHPRVGRRPVARRRRTSLSAAGGGHADRSLRRQ